MADALLARFEFSLAIMHPATGLCAMVNCSRLPIIPLSIPSLASNMEETEKLHLRFLISWAPQSCTRVKALVLRIIS